MKPAPFSFVRPQGLQHALEALAADPGAKVLAGGQSLVPLLNMRLAAPSTLVDINGLPDLDHVRADQDGVRVGALARHADVLASPDVRRVQPLLSIALEHVAHATIRNRGTVVGSLVHADAAAELPAVLALLGGTVTVASTRGTREIAAADLFAGPLESTVAPRRDRAWRRSSRPSRRATGSASPRSRAGTATTRSAASPRWCASTVTRSSQPAPATSPSPTCPPWSTSPRSLADGVTEASLAAAGEEALAHLDPGDDIHATAAYRSRLVRVLTAPRPANGVRRREEPGP